MARLKVKQISDFTSAVQNLIDIDVDQNAASISSALSAGVSAGVVAGAVSTELINEVSSIDLILAGKAGNGDVTAVSDALSVEIAATNSDVTRIDGLLASVATDGELSSEVASIDTRISGEEVTRSLEVKAVSNAVSAILTGSTTDLDQFAEVISYVDSLDTADGGALTSQIASLGVIISTNSSLDVVLSEEVGDVSDALSVEISNTNSDVLSLETVLGTMGTSETIGNISDALSAEISNTNSDVNSIDVRLSVDELAIDAVASGITYAHDFGTVVSKTQFTISNVLDVRSTKDLLVFINGHNIHPLKAFEGEGEREGGDGYQSADGQTFDLVNIGYEIDATDHIYVTGIRA